MASRQEQQGTELVASGPGDEIVSVADVARLRAELGAAVLRDLIDSALTDMGEALERLDAMIAAVDAAGARILAHGLAGLAASYALPALAEALRTAAEAARLGDMAATVSGAAAARRLYDVSAPALRRALGAVP